LQSKKSRVLKSDKNSPLLYTGVTRGKNLVVIVGQRRALSIAVHGKIRRERYTKLKDWLQEEEKS
jgi:exodeoxyribonuclease V alpha subunit